MRLRLLAAALLVAAALVFGLAVRGPAAPHRASRAGLEVVPLNPHALAALKAQGRSVKKAVPAGVNQGRKFNPKGDLVGQLPAAYPMTLNVLVLCVDFSDEPPGGPAQRLDLTYFDDMLFGTKYDPPDYAIYPAHPTDRTLANYVEQTSFGRADIVTLNAPSAMGWLHSGKPYSYYCRADGIHDNGFGPYPENAQGLVIDAIKAADAQGVDFSKYAVDGVVPNLFVVHAGTGAEWSAAPDIIWSHSFGLDVPSGTDLEGGLTVDGVKVNNYAMMPEVGGDLTGYSGDPFGPYPPTVGVFAHEFGHVLGLPDQYDYGYESNGTGMFSLMAGRQLEPVLAGVDLLRRLAGPAGRLEQVPPRAHHAHGREDDDSCDAEACRDGPRGLQVGRARLRRQGVLPVREPPEPRLRPGAAVLLLPEPRQRRRDPADPRHDGLPRRRLRLHARLLAAERGGELEGVPFRGLAQGTQRRNALCDLGGAG